MTQPTYSQWTRREADMLADNQPPSTKLPDTVAQKVLSDVLVAKTTNVFKSIGIITLGNLVDRMAELGLHRSHIDSGTFYHFANPEAQQIKASPQEAVQHWTAVLTYIGAMGIQWETYVRNPEVVPEEAPSAPAPVQLDEKPDEPVARAEPWSPPRAVSRPIPMAQASSFENLVPVARLRDGYHFRFLEEGGTRINPHIWMVIDRNYRGSYWDEGANGVVEFQGVWIINVTNGRKAVIMNKGLEVQFVANGHCQIILRAPGRRDLLYGPDLSDREIGLPRYDPPYPRPQMHTESAPSDANPASPSEDWTRNVDRLMDIAGRMQR